MATISLKSQKLSAARYNNAGIVANHTTTSGTVQSCQGAPRKEQSGIRLSGRTVTSQKAMI